MKYLAIVKDSILEAIDAKVLYVTLGLSGVLILILASVRFDPEPVDGQLSAFFNLYNLGAASKPTPFVIEVVEAVQTNPEVEPYEGKFRIVLRVKSLRREPLSKIDKGHMLTEAEIVSRHILWWAEKLEFKEATGKDATEAQTVLTTDGTKLKSMREWSHVPSLFFGGLPMPLLRNTLNYWVYWIENRLVNWAGGWVAVLIGVIVTASFLPNMLRKGTVDLLLAKPVYRVTLLLFKYVGGLTFVFLNAMAAIVGVWLVIGVRTGIWSPGFLLSAFVITFFFAILYSISTLTAVVTRSTVVCIMVTLLAWGFFWLVGTMNAIANPPKPRPEAEQVRRRPRPEPQNDNPLGIPPWMSNGVAALHKVTPRTDDLSRITTAIISRDQLSEAERRAFEFDESDFSVAECLSVNFAFVGLFLGLACWRFATKDY